MLPLILPGCAAVNPVLLEAAKQPLIVLVGCCRFVHYYDVEPGQFKLVVPKRFPNESLQPVPAAGFFALLLGDRQAKPRCRPVIAPAKHGKAFVAAAGGFFKDAAESRSVQQPVVFSKPVPGVAIQLGVFVCRANERADAGRELRCEFCAAFGPAALKNEAACLGRHTGTETVRAGALQFAGLIRAFHLPVTWFTGGRKSPSIQKGGKGTWRPHACQ